MMESQSHKVQSAETALKNTTCMLPHQELQVYPHIMLALHQCMIKFYITLARSHVCSQPLTKVEECVRVHVCAVGGNGGGGGAQHGGGGWTV